MNPNLLHHAVKLFELPPFGAILPQG